MLYLRLVEVVLSFMSSGRYLPAFSFKNFLILLSPVSSLVHLELIFVCVVKCVSECGGLCVSVFYLFLYDGN